MCFWRAGREGGGGELRGWAVVGWEGEVLEVLGCSGKCQQIQPAFETFRFDDFITYIP